MTKEMTVVQEKAITIRDYINKKFIVDQIQAALPEFMNAKRFLRTVYTALLRNPALLDCTKESLLSALIESAQLGLEPILGKAALIPYGREVQFQPMYRGLIDLARRTGQVKVTGHVVYSNDDFDFEYGTAERLYHKPSMDDDRGSMIGAYTVWTFEDGFQSFLFMPQSDILKVREKSQAWQYARANPNKTNAQETPWITWPDQQGIKTVIKRHSKLQPCSVEMERAVELDNRAEAKLSQADMLGKFTDSTGKLPAPEEKTTEELIKEFNDSIPKGTDQEHLNDWLTASAEHFGRSIDEIKANAAGDLDGFWKQFKRFEKDLEKPTAKKSSNLSEEEEKIAGYWKDLRTPGLIKQEKISRSEMHTWSLALREVWKAKWSAVMEENYTFPEEMPREEKEEPEPRTMDNDRLDDAELETLEEEHKGPAFTAICPNTGEKINLDVDCDNCPDKENEHGDPTCDTHWMHEEKQQGNRE